VVNILVFYLSESVTSVLEIGFAEFVILDLKLFSNTLKEFHYLLASIFTITKSAVSLTDFL
jgi:hypothetical protein